MYTNTELARKMRASIEQAIADKKRRLENCRFYAAATAPGQVQESANSHKMWKQDENELLIEISELEEELKKFKKV